MSHAANSTGDPAILVMTKAPVPGLAKTRLCPPCTPHEAAQLAAAALADTLDAATRVGRVFVALDGAPGEWLPADVPWFAQQGDTFADRLEHAWVAVGPPLFQIGMDTPQLTTDGLCDALAAVDRDGAALGPAWDGGWWGLGLREAAPGPLFAGVAMSRADTGQAQLDRLRALGVRVTLLDELRDVDTFEDAVAVADVAPDTRFGRLVAEMAR